MTEQIEKQITDNQFILPIIQVDLFANKLECMNQAEGAGKDSEVNLKVPDTEGDLVRVDSGEIKIDTSRPETLASHRGLVSQRQSNQNLTSKFGV